MRERVQEIQPDLLASCPTCRGTDDGIQSAIPIVRLDRLAGAGTIDRLSEQVKFGHQAWMERLREMQDVEAEYTKELLAARDPNEGLKIGNRWIAKRLALLTADSKAFTGFWIDLVMTAAGGTQPRDGGAAQG